MLIRRLHTLSFTVLASHCESQVATLFRLVGSSHKRSNGMLAPNSGSSLESVQQMLTVELEIFLWLFHIK
jgi:hypothetical protein